MLLALAAIGCSMADGLPPPPHETEPYDPPPPQEGSADSTGGDNGQSVDPEYGDNCGPDVLGWPTICEAQSTKRKYTDPLRRTAVTVDDELGSDFAKLCCEGLASREVANGGCQELCMNQLCEEARQAHMWWALDVAPGCLLGSDACGFDMATCVTGNPHIQTLDDPADVLDPLQYLLDVDCSAKNASDRGVTGNWEWLEYPDNMADNDPPMCFSPSVLGVYPGSRRPQFRLSEAPGTQATFTWQLGEARGIETTQDLRVEAGYTLVPCDGGQRSCIELTGLDMSMPSTTIQGLSLGECQLVLEELGTSPFELVGDGFVVPNQALRFMMSGSVNGLPISLAGYNDGPVEGRLSSSSLTLSGLEFGYHDDVFRANLRVDVSVMVDARKPSASIRVLDAPPSCGEDVVFDASSVDPEGGSLSYVWWYPPAGFFEGTSLTASMAPGSHTILLMARDSMGYSDATGIRYDRVCL